MRQMTVSTIAKWKAFRPMANDGHLSAIKSRGIRLHFGLRRVLFHELVKKVEELVMIEYGRL